MNAIWISDAHLSDPASPSYTALMDLLNESLAHVDAVVLLGDFFELWLGDNRCILSRHRPILDTLAPFKSHGTSIHYLKGNHDFILGTIWEQVLGARVFDLDADFLWDGYRFFASHGESIYKKDYAYRVMRKFLRNPLLERSIRLLGDEFAARLSVRFASLSGGRPNGRKERDQQTAFLRYARKKLEQGYHAAILGHTHVMQWHVFSVEHAPRLYVNPGSWREQNTYLWYGNGRFQIRQYRKPQPIVLFDFAFSVA